MTTCPHCGQPIPDPPKSSNILLKTSNIVLIVLLTGFVGVVSCGLIVVVCLAAITTIGSKANTTFKTVGSSLSSGGR